MNKTNRQKGAVSLFVVIFAALLITVVTVSFVRIMIQNQKQASAVDLSQSAYDSAQAGVEDAKRALLRYQDICNSGGDCSGANAQINSTTCNTAVGALNDVAAASSGNEVKVQNSTGNSLDQAYTCVKINTVTDDYVGVLNQDSVKVIPLVGVSNFGSIRLEWFNSSDLQGAGSTVNVPASVNGTPLLRQNSWTSSTSQNRPSVLRAQLIEYNTLGFNLSDFNGSVSGNSTSNSLFLYPSDISGASSFSSNIRISPTPPSSPNIPTQVECSDNLSGGGYACIADLAMPRAVSNSHKAYLILKPFYKARTSFRITLISGNKVVQFDGVQPSIDSTGRANDLFRRVQARVEMIDDSFPYPRAEIDINGNLCKDFMITDDPTDYRSNSSCNP